MVQLNRNPEQLTVTIDGDTNELVGMQKALIDLMMQYNFKEFGLGAQETFYFTLVLLDALIPDHDQQRKGLISNKNIIELPDNLTPEQIQTIRTQIMKIAKPELTISKEPDSLAEATNHI